jgi:hypothetical protein
MRSSIFYPTDVSSWVVRVSDGAAHLTLAGWWRTFVSQPLFNALLAVWACRLALWIRFMFLVSRMNLRLVAAHPDRLGGVRFTLIPLRGFAILGFAIGAVVAGTIAQNVIFGGESLSSYRYLIGAQVLIVLLLFAGPSLLWMRPLIRLHGSGVLHYGGLASRMGHAFEEKWLDDNPGQEALHAQDFSATTDLYSIVENVTAMNVYVLDAQNLMLLAGPTLLPYVPVLLAVMPLDDVLRFAVKAFA